MDSDKKLLNVSLPDSLYQALKNYQQQQQLEEPASAVVAILAQFFQLGEETKPNATEEAESYATTEQLSALASQVAHLNKQVTALKQVLATYTSTTPQAMSAVAASSSTQITNSVPQTTSAAAISSIYDIEEDEPDEILHDFL